MSHMLETVAVQRTASSSGRSPLTALGPSLPRTSLRIKWSAGPPRRSRAFRTGLGPAVFIRDEERQIVISLRLQGGEHVGPAKPLLR